MGKITPATSFGLGSEKASKGVFSKNHYASASMLPLDVQQKIADWGLTRVAGNAYICEASHDFWQVKGNKILKLVGDEVNDGDSIRPAPEDKPQQFIEHLLDDLEF